MSEEIKNATTLPTSEVGETPALDNATDSVRGKGKAAEAPVEDDDEDDEDDDEDEEMDDEDEDEEEDFSEIDPSAIITSSRRSTRSTVDYSSAEAAKKAGLAEGIEEEEEDDGAEADQTFDED